MELIQHQTEMALTITPEDGTGLAGANSYISQAAADTYFEAHLYAAAWTAATSVSKDKALAMATRLLDASTDWKGDKKTAAQSLQWPREGVEHDGFEVATNAIPVEVLNATAELAGLLISENLTAEVDQNQLASIGLGKGALEIGFKDQRSKRQIPIHINDLLRGLGIVRTGGSGITIRKVSR